MQPCDTLEGSECMILQFGCSASTNARACFPTQNPSTSNNCSACNYRIVTRPISVYAACLYICRQGRCAEKELGVQHINFRFQHVAPQPNRVCWSSSGDICWTSSSSSQMAYGLLPSEGPQPVQGMDKTQPPQHHVQR